MRNLKRALSLTLASVMLLGMMVMGTSAAASYDDVKETDNVEAIEVLQAVKIMVGDERGFGPERPVNRAEMAVIMGLLLNLDYNYYSATCPFNDVYDWARGWVGACAANGIVSGRGAGVYDPGATVTAVEAASMLMRALGYFKYSNDYADGFEVSTVRQGTNIGIFDGVGSSATEPMTRNQVAQMVLNALKSGVVQPDGNTINLTTPDGSVYTGKVNYVYITSNKAFATAISSTRASSMGSFNDSPIVELGEQLYDGRLKLNDTTTDAFRRPARYWEYDGKAIGTYVKKELLKAEYTTEVTGKQLYDLLGKDIVEDYLFKIAIDGERDASVLGTTGFNGNSGDSTPGSSDRFYFTEGNLIRTNTKGIGGTGNGVLTQVFVDPDEVTNSGRLNRGTVYIAVINTYLAKANDDYDAKREQVEFNVWSLENLASSGNPILVKNTNDTAPGNDKAYRVDLKVKNEDINVENVKDGDIVLVHVADGEIKEILEPEVIADTELSSFKDGSWVNNGTRYDYANSATYDDDVLDAYVRTNMKDATYNLYLDKYGYMIGIELLDKKLDYLFLTGIDGSTSNLANKTAQGNVILLDGTMSTVTIKLGDSEYSDGAAMSTTVVGTHQLNSTMNTWCTYSVNANGEYVLKEVANNPTDYDNLTGKKIGQSHVRDESAGGADLTLSGAFAKYKTIDKKHVSTMGFEYKTSSDTILVAYGTDDSVYLNVSTGLIRATRPTVWDTGADEAIIIDDVAAVTTGVQKADITALSAYSVWKDTKNVATITDKTGQHTAIDVDDLDAVAHGIYNLFDSDGAIIAAVVVGEDNSASTGYAYVTSNKMNQESFDKTKSEWTWSREVIVNGEITNLTEVKGTNTTPDIGKMVRGQWYEVKYKADGTVKSAGLISWDSSADDGATGDNAVNPSGLTLAGEFFAAPNDNVLNGTSVTKYVGLIRKVEKAVTSTNSTVVLSTDLTGSYTDGVPQSANNYYSITPDTRWPITGFYTGTNNITTTGNTLWIEDAVQHQKDGFAVRNDAKVVLVQDTHVFRNGIPVKTNVMENRYEYSVTGKEALAKVIKDMHDSTKFVGFISAVFEGGVATSVVIWDQTPEDIETYNPDMESSSNWGGTVNYVCVVTGTANYSVTVSVTDVPNGANLASAAYRPNIPGTTFTGLSHTTASFSGANQTMTVVATYTMP